MCFDFTSKIDMGWLITCKLFYQMSLQQCHTFLIELATFIRYLLLTPAGE